jgi:hypothetical protein
MNKKTIIINFAKIKEIALLGVRRTAVFMGLGINAALDENFRNFDLTKIIQLQFVPQDVDDKTIAHIKEEFGIWIISCGFRELIETFLVFLDEIHLASLHMAVSRGIISSEDAKKYGPAFPKKGIKDKLPILLNRFGIYPNNSDFIITINQARNCLTHRRGIVGVEDCYDKQKLEIKWIGFDIFLETPSGEIFCTYPLPEEGIYLKDGGTAGIKFTERTLNFKIGEQLKLSPRNLAEICQFIILSTHEICANFLRYADSLGIKINHSK